MSIAITGGIGAGKSYLCKLLEARGVRVYDCDAAAKRLMRTTRELQQRLREVVGTAVFKEDGTLDKGVLAQFLLAGEEQKQAVNAVVHPAVAADFIASDCDWLESAILFESGFYKRVSFQGVVCVTAPHDVRLQRIILRDGISQVQAQAWIDRQMPQEEMVRRSNFEVVNDGVQSLEAQVDKLLEWSCATLRNKIFLTEE